MEKLTNKEEEIMQILWKLENAFINDILEATEAPKPHYNTLSTIVRILEDKGFVGHRAYGKSHQYFPVITKEAYRSVYVKDSIIKYFDNSVSDLVSYFVKDESITQSDYDEIMAIIEKSKPKK
ncbi:BlaI/MecI/CopY family transcriptional regulator [Myroides ceti]|uniref:BlaI/MecI/CopY family transcriptional regulator n=1 Tax=Paenimyroides ceti TaxID=395087 RepID=A0ABT8CN84_9FLAO|nr:BlaI/MecI/CopY family transcriptional regulator [Paenimyroides ceti]MDN3705660.1 BlaI/MecI/CopY family transcriptional regulator [Paenimyroides ceti]MDN3709435.1 BlaI/MecI/CopY family transcriptional regulator [Paenimyroides ceti]